MKYILLVVCLSGSTIFADGWQVQHDGRLLNANFVGAGSAKQVYLIVHGTWAHHEMEIITSLQGLLGERNASSLAITLSLGVSERSGFMSCDNPVVATQDMAVDEIRVWVNTLRARGFEWITVIGHSRGSSQVALYEHQHPGSVSALVLLAPAVWRKDAVFTRYNARTDHDINTILEEARSTTAQLIGPYPLINCASVLATPASFLSYYGESVEKNTPALVQSSTVPVQIVLGSLDEVVQWSDDELQRVKANRFVRVDTIDGAGHFFRDLYLDDVTDLIMAADE